MNYLIKNKNFFIFFVKIVLTIFLLFYIFSFVDKKVLLEKLGMLSAEAILLVIFALVCQVLLSGTRFFLVLNSISNELSLFRAIKFSMIGGLFSQLSPGGISGDAAKIFYCTRAHLPIRKSIHAVAIERFITLVSLVFLAAIANFFSSNNEEFLHVLTIISAAISLVAFIFVKYFFPKIDKLFSRLKTVQLFLMDLSLVLAFPRKAISLFFLAGLIHLIYGCVFVFILRSMGATPDWLTAISLAMIGFLISQVPISISGWGIREASMAYLFKVVHVPVEISFSTSLLFGLFVLLVSLSGFIPFFLEKATKEA